MAMKEEDLTDHVQYIAGLFFRRLQNDLSEREQQDLDAWLDQQDPDSQKFFQEMTDLEEIRNALYILYQIDGASAFMEVQKKIQQEDEAAASSLAKRFHLWSPFKFKYVAAVLLLIGLGGALFVLLRPREKGIVVVPAGQRFKNDVSPGGQKAILELADGKRIVLDSASNGELAHEGGMRVIKLDNGQLSYQRSGSHQQDEDAVTYNTVTTPRGGRYEVILTDGSRVWLNAASSLRFPTHFVGKQRLVVLSGEAYFEVAKNSAMPFKVQVDRGQPMEIEVLGTRFNIEAYADEPTTRATLIDGSVKVSGGQQQALLKPGDQATVGDGNASVVGDNRLKVVSGVNTDDVIAWKNGLFQFRDAELSSILRQVSRWYDVEIVYKGKVSQQFVGKIPRSVNLSTLLTILESTGWVHFKIEGKKITAIAN